jgi:cell division protein FtsI/penicillin-binding protein 2
MKSDMDMIRTRLDATNEMSTRYLILAGIFFIIALAIVYRLVNLQFSPEAEFFKEQGDSFSRTLYPSYPPRGQIYDRYGRLLAGNTLAYEVGVETANVSSPETIVFALTKALMGHPEYNKPEFYDQRLYAIREAQNNGTAYVPLADYVTPEELALLQSWAEGYMDSPIKDENGVSPSLDGLVYKPRMQRVYPEGSLAGNVIGFVNRDGAGQFGVEQQFNEMLAGEAQMVWRVIDPYLATELSDQELGADLVLTIDRDIQAVVEDILDEALVETGAVGGTILVMDPNTGEMLAMAVTPRMNLNEYYNYADVFTGTTPYNRAVSTDYEPGSVFKVLTMASALDSGSVKLNTVFMDTGAISIGGITIHNWDYGAWGQQDMQGCMQHSLNVCLTWIATQMGAGTFYDYLQEFGLGFRTGIDLALEVPGRLKVPGDTDWYEADLGTNSFGQGVTVTPLQMITAIGAVANEGQMLSPHVVRSIIQNDHQYDPAPQVLSTPIRAKTARQLTEMLANSLENESSDALVTGYRVAGKTGTAEIAVPGMGYTSDLTNASFVGWGPVEAPQFIVYIWLEKPQTSPWGSVVASPVFREVVEQLVILMDIPPDDIRVSLGSQ